MLPGPGSTSISVPLRFSHKPPEARIWLIAMNLAPPVPKKVMVSLDGLSSVMTNLTIEDSCIFYNPCLQRGRLVISAVIASGAKQSIIVSEIASSLMILAITVCLIKRSIVPFDA